MSVQDVITLTIGVLAGAYLAWRLVRRRLFGTCCGQRECPASKRILENLGRKPS